MQCYRGWYVETGYVNTILGKLHKLKYAILTRHNTNLGHTRFARSFQRTESLFGGMGRTAHKLETNAHANLPMADNLAYQCMENGGEKHAHADILVAQCAFHAQYLDICKHIDRSLENVLKVVSVLCVLRTPSKGTTNGGN